MLKNYDFKNLTNTSFLPKQKYIKVRTSICIFIDIANRKICHNNTAAILYKRLLSYTQVYSNLELFRIVSDPTNSLKFPKTNLFWV